MRICTPYTSSLLRRRRWGGTLSAIKRLINPPSIMLRVVDDRILSVGITHLVDQGRIAGANSKPIEVRVVADLLALIEESDQTGTEDIAAEINGNLFVQVDVVAVLLHTLHTGLVARLSGVSLGSMSAIGRPSIHWQRDRLRDGFEEQAVRYGHVCGTASASCEEAQCAQDERRLHCGGSVRVKLEKCKM